MRIAAIIAATAGLWLSLGSEPSAGTEFCRNDRLPVVRVRTFLGEPNYRFDLPGSAVPSILNARGMIGGDHDGLAGFMASLRYSLTPSARISEPSPGQFCALAEGVVVEFRYEKREVVIARETMADVCVHREYLLHMLRHVRIDDELLLRFASESVPHLQRLFFDVTVKAGSDPEAAERNLTSALGATIEEVAREFLALERARQAGVDYPEEIERFMDACDGKVGEFAARWSRRQTHPFQEP